MSKIKVMDELLANKIAAGEVIEKLASIVKELVENSIDAKSTNIKVNLINSGMDLIEVIDDGEGMDKIDAKSFLSKVKEVKSFDGKVFIITNNKDLKSGKTYKEQKHTIDEQKTTIASLKSKVKKKQTRCTSTTSSSDGKELTKFKNLKM